MWLAFKMFLVAKYWLATDLWVPGAGFIWFALYISRFQDWRSSKLTEYIPPEFDISQFLGWIKSPKFEGFQGSLLEQVWICDLEVHQQVAAGAVDVATVTLKIKIKLVIFSSFCNLPFPNALSNVSHVFVIRNLYCKSVNIFSCQSYIHFSAPIFQNAQMAKTLKRFIHCRRICKNAKSIFVFSQLQQNFLVCQFISRFSISVSELRLFSAPICQSVFRTTSPWQMAKTMKENNCQQMCPENKLFRSISAKKN